MTEHEPSPAIIDQFLATYLDGIEQLRQAFPAVTSEAIRDGLRRRASRVKADRRERAREKALAQRQ